jgi:hypothetical protein
VTLKNVTAETRQPFDLVIYAQNVRTPFGHLYPYIMFIEAVSVGVKSCQLPTSFLHLPASVHRGILLVTEHNTITGLALPRAFTALATYGLLFVAFQLSLAASKTVNQTEN